MAAEIRFAEGELVVVELALPRGMGADARNTSAATIERVARRNDGTVDTVFARLTGLTPTPYQPGDVMPVDADKVRAAGW